MTFQIELVSPEAITYQGEADMVIARTVGGGDIATAPGVDADDTAHGRGVHVLFAVRGVHTVAIDDDGGVDPPLAELESPHLPACAQTHAVYPAVGVAGDEHSLPVDIGDHGC